MSEKPVAVNPFSAVEEGQRHAVYAELARKGPVHRVTLPHGPSAWLVTGHEEARAMLTDPRVVKLGPHSGAFAKRLPEDVARGIHSHLLYLNPPDHTRLRRLITAAFTRRRIDDVEPLVRTLTRNLLDDLDETEPIDLVTRFAYPIPMGTIGAMLGIPSRHEHDFRRWTTPLMSPELVGYQAYAAAAEPLLELLRRLIADKRRQPADDLLSALVHTRDGSDQLSEDELTSMSYLLVLAGHETTVNLITNAVLALLAHPEELASLHAAPDTIDQVIEEVLRYDGSTQTTMPARTSTDVEAGRVTIPAGEMIFIALVAANRDPARFSSPDRFAPSRLEQGHLAFGHGIHYCLGAPLARLEARTAVGELVARFPAMRLAVPHETLTRTASVTMNALDSLPVRLR